LVKKIVVILLIHDCNSFKTLRKREMTLFLHTGIDT